MAYFDTTQPASFNDIKFPVDDIDIHGSQRHYVHYYAHQDGGNLEKLGRNLYMIRVHIPAMQGIRQYPNIYPDGIAALRAGFELGYTATLTLPNLGSIRAYIVDFAQKWSARVRSGESVTIDFLEDQPTDDLDQFNATGLASLTTMSHMYDTLVALQAQAADVPTPLWTKLDNAFRNLLALRDKADMQASLLEAKILDVTNTFSAIDRAIQDPPGYRCLDAVHALWEATVKLAVAGALPANAAANVLSPFGKWTVPMVMTIVDISIKLFGDSTHTMELLQMNDVGNAFAVKAGTVINYVKPVSSGAYVSKVAA